MEFSPGVKLLLKLRKDWLVFKADEMGVLSTGTKQQIAIRIDQAEEEVNTRYWDSISNGKRGGCNAKR